MKKLLLSCGLLACLTWLLPNEVGAQTTPDSTAAEKDDFLAFYPLVFYFPETRLGFGGAAVYNYYPGKGQNNRPSQIQLGAAYTLNKQLLLYASYQYFLRQNRTELFGEIGYYDYFYFYYGIGNETLDANEETYFVKFPRLRINALEQVFSNFRVGLSYKFDQYNITEIQTDGLLDKIQPTGVDGGTISTLGLLARYDTRDNINLPRTGFLITASLEHNDQWLGSPFTYSRWLLDFISYLPIQERQVVALNLYTGGIWGAPPFQELLFLGGSKKGRGIVEGRFREEALFLVQGAYRFPLFWRFRAAVFASAGQVASTFGDFGQGTLHFNYGGGIRFLLAPQEGIQIRLDVGFGSDQPGFYLTIGEAF